MMNKPWLAHYPKNVPSEIDPGAYSSLIELLQENLTKYSDLPAYVNMGTTISYKEVDELSTAFANFLTHETPLQPGDRVALQMPNLLQYPVALFGVIKAGMIAVNTNPQYKPSEMKHQFNDAGARAVVILSNFADKLEEILPQTKSIETIIVTDIGDMLGPIKGPLINFLVRNVKKMVPPYQLHASVPFKETIKQGKKHTYQKPKIESDQLAILQYTGGTTGVAKGAALSHRNMIANIEQVGAWMKPLLKERTEVVVTAIPLYHVFALTVNCFGFVKMGGKNVLITDPRNMKSFMKTLKKNPFSVITGVNTLFNGMLQQPQFKAMNFSKLKVAVAGAMALQKSVADNWRKVTGNDIVEGYGLSETSPLLACNPIDGNHKLGTIGVPVPSTEIKIADDDGNEQKVGEAGEIWAKGPQVMTGYWQNPAETANVMEGEWFKTGDIAIFDHDGYLKIVDRKKEMINVSGMKVFPNEVENVIAGMEKVLEVGVIGVPDKNSGELVKAFIVKKDSTLQMEEVVAHCKEHLVAYKVPKYVEFRKDLPKSNVGKILRKDLHD